MKNWLGLSDRDHVLWLITQLCRWKNWPVVKYFWALQNFFRLLHGHFREIFDYMLDSLRKERSNLQAFLKLFFLDDRHTFNLRRLVLGREQYRGRWSRWRKINFLRVIECEGVELLLRAQDTCINTRISRIGLWWQVALLNTNYKPWSCKTVLLTLFCLLIYVFLTAAVFSWLFFFSFVDDLVNVFCVFLYVFECFLLLFALLQLAHLLDLAFQIPLANRLTKSFLRWDISAF